MIWIVACSILLILAVFFIWLGYMHSKVFVVEHYEFTTDKLSDDFHFVFLSDLHEIQYDSGNKSLLKTIDNLSPDCVLVGGDMITSYKALNEEYYSTLDFLKKLSEKHDVYYSLGNHERALYDLKEYGVSKKRRSKDGSDIERANGLSKILSENGAKLLRNSSVERGELSILGLDLPLDFYRRIVRKAPAVTYLKGLFNEDFDSKYKIMMAHDPEHFKEYSQMGVDLVLSGHVHGGIVRIPGIGGVISPQLRIFPKYDSGVFNSNNCGMLVSRGIGTHSVPIRLFNKAEVCDVFIRASHKGD